MPGRLLIMDVNSWTNRELSGHFKPKLALSGHIRKPRDVEAAFPFPLALRSPIA
ncbi:hypothetical protein [Acetobacter okinawensis]|uniref:hypothetical protein n=1 Tax=Acetobacter okinawensis TaxID=1076594 RepID=UPI00131F249A|nr:hypothetical protein [Acetobacter okinawensis]MCP1213585.1 hypothetical protein [Acetobacter okinawensis]